MLVALLLVLHFSLAAALVCGMNWLALHPWRRAREAHWTERARLLWPVRVTSGMLLFFAPVFLGAAQMILFPEMPLSYLFTALAGLAGAALGAWPMTHAMFPQLPFRSWLGDLATVFVLRLSILGVLLAAAGLMPSQLDWTAIPLTAVVLGTVLWKVYGGGLSLLRRTRAVTVPPDRLAAIVSEVSARMGVPLPRVWLLRSVTGNALALPVIHTLVVTEGAMEALSDEELGAVCAHEFAHLDEPRGVLLARVLAAFAVVPAIFLKPAIHSGGAMGSFVIGGSMFIISHLTRKLRQRMEKRADSMATTHEGPSVGAYARVLERIYEMNQAPAVVPGSMVHPSLYDRLLAAGVTPTYPRPALPARFPWHHIVAMLLFAAAVGAVIQRFVLAH